MLHSLSVIQAYIGYGVSWLPWGVQWPSPWLTTKPVYRDVFVIILAIYVQGKYEILRKLYINYTPSFLLPPVYQRPNTIQFSVGVLPRVYIACINQCGKAISCWLRFMFTAAVVG